LLSIVTCPSCGFLLIERAAECPQCRLPLTGPVALALWQTDHELAALQLRRTELLAELRASVAKPAAAPAPAGAPSPPLPASPPVEPRYSGQQLLLAVGALLVLTAAVVFVAVTWSAIGVLGQVALMAAVTAASAVGALQLSRRRLVATAQTLAVLTVGLAVLDVGAAYTLNLAGLGRLDEDVYGYLSSALLAVVFAALAWRDHHLWAFSIAAVIAAAAIPLFMLAAAGSPEVVVALVCALTTAGLVGVRAALPVRWDVARATMVPVAVCYLLATWLAAMAAVGSEQPFGAGGLAGLVGLAAAAAAGWWSGVHRGIRGLSHPALAVAAVAAGVVIVVGYTWRVDESGTGLCLLAGVAAAVAGWLAWPRRPLADRPVGVVVGVLQVVAAVALVAGYSSYLDGLLSDLDLLPRLRGLQPPVWLALTVALAVTAASSCLTAVRHPRAREGAAGYAAALAVGSAAVAASPSGLGPLTVTLTTMALVLAAAAAWRRSRREERILAAVAVLAATAAGARAADLGPEALAAVLATVGLAAFGYGILPGRGNVALLGVAGCSASVWVLLDDADVRTVEAYSLPLAALIAVVGVVRLRREPGSPSWLTVGPALTAGLIPSALASMDDPAVTRPLLVLLAAAAVLVGGVLLRWQAPVLTAVVALVLVSVAQLAPYAVGLPRWLTFGSVGLVLLVLGARYEQRRRNALQAARWVTALR
jgi:hypothetical protein